ncbi:HamA C-terminal domain-containing protein [Sphingobacterium spiritivorum]|uniref:HamA C-terminal domain-containing protein n=1 Tax=Sphingobacterium spiritivorum TaxID=258 RepID=UPI003DA344FF
MSRPFKSDLVINEHISESGLKAYHIGFDKKFFRIEPLVDIIRNVIPEFSLGYHCGTNIPLTEIVERLKEAAETVYLTEKYQTRGEFGELILHLLLRDFHNTIPLISKMYFKDAHNVPAHGFDGVQITINGDEKKMWLGESKLYKTGKSGVNDLINDIKKHVNEDYIRKEFNLISRKLPESVPEIEHWRTLMDKHQTLDKIFSSIVIPMVCTYNSNLFSTHKDNTKEYFEEFEKECRDLYDHFNKSKPACSVEIVLLLLPVADKDELNTKLDERLKAMQKI